MNRYLHLDTSEVISEIGNDFIFKKGQIFRDKAYDDEYIVITEIGDQVNEQVDGLVEDSKVQYNVVFWSCTPLGQPVRVSWEGNTSSVAYSHYDLIRKYYFFTGKTSPQAYLDIVEPAEKGDHIGRSQITNPLMRTIKRKPKPDPAIIEEHEKYEARLAAKLKAINSDTTSPYMVFNSATTSIF